MEKKEKTLIIVLIVFLLAVSLSTAGYVIYDKFLKPAPKENTINNLNNTSMGIEPYTKTISVEYNNEKHKVAIEHTSIKKNTENLNYTEYNIYIDDALIGTKKAFQEYQYSEEKTENRLPSEDIRSMKNAEVYVMDNKYLVIVLPSVEQKESYTAYFYNGNKEITQTEIINGFTTFVNKDNKEILTIDTIEFDGTSLKYYDKCSYQSKTGQISYISTTFDGTKLNKKVLRTETGITAAGADPTTNCKEE